MLKNSGEIEFSYRDTSAPWLVLVIGNSRLHWASFLGRTLEIVWDMPHLPPELVSCLVQHQLHFRQCIDWLEEVANLSPDVLAVLSRIPAQLPLWIASVIPAQTQIWQAYNQSRVLTLDQIPLNNLYPTLGIDRALALLGAATYYGLPSLVIDAGTALTFTGVDSERQLIGGAILPGLQLQLRSLAEHTAALPQLSTSDLSLPSRWSTSTAAAIWSGVLHTLLAGIQDFVQAWQQQFSGGSIVLTGGDANLVLGILQQQNPGLAAQIKVDAQIIFRGIRVVHQSSSRLI
jgi:type III pantothenate kinase